MIRIPSASSVARAPPHVGEADRLTACHVHRRGNRDVRNPIGADFVYERLELHQIHVALEWVIRRGIVRFVDDDVVERAAGELLVQLASW